MNIDAQTLVLNRGFQPVNITNAKRALCMLYSGIARAIDDEAYQLFDFASWSELAARENDETISTTRRLIRLPKVIVLCTYAKIPIGRIRFTRQNIYTRDKHTCQYCYKQFDRRSLNIDHVIPRVLKGGTHWKNVVTSCIKCNSKKGGRTPKQAGMKLLSLPKEPQWSDLAVIGQTRSLHHQWLPYLSAIDSAYWNVELETD